MPEIKKIRDMLPTGRENAISMDYLSGLLGMSHRDLRHAILTERLEGAVICGDSYGYYLPADDTELYEYYHTAKTRAMTCLKSLTAARKALKKMEEKQNEVHIL